MEDLSKRLEPEKIELDLADLKSSAIDYITSGAMSGDMLVLSDDKGESIEVDVSATEPTLEYVTGLILEFRHILVNKPGMNKIIKEYDEHFKIECAREGKIGV